MNTYHRENLRSELIEEGIRLIHQGSTQKLSLRKIAEACGVSHSAPYSHFKNLADLLACMQQHIIDQLIGQMEAIIALHDDKTAMQLMIDLGRCYVLFFIDHPAFFTFLFAQNCGDTNLSLEDDDSGNFRPFALFKATVLPIFDANGIPETRWEDKLISCWATVHGLSTIANMKGVHYSRNWSEKVEDILWMKNIEGHCKETPSTYGKRGKG